MKSQTLEDIKKHNATVLLVIRRAEEVAGMFRLAEARKDSFDPNLKIALENLTHALSIRVQS